MKLILISSLLMFLTPAVYANSNAQSQGCSGIVFKLEGMEDSDSAKVLTNGHCIYSFVNEKDPESAKDVRINKRVVGDVFLYKGFWDLGKKFASKNYIYVTMYHNDVAIIELYETYAKLKKLGYEVYTVANSELRTGVTYSFNSDYKQLSNECTVEEEVDTLLESIWMFKKVFKLKMEKGCELVSGMSGTAAVKDNEIYGLAVTRYEGKGSPCSRDNPCEVENGKKKTSRPGRVYAQSVNYLYDCYSQEKGKFDFALKNCPLISK